MSEKDYMQEAIDSYKLNANRETLRLIESLPKEAQLQALKNSANSSSIGTPIGSNKGGLEQYMTYNEAKDEIRFDIPASKLMNRGKNKELLGE